METQNKNKLGKKIKKYRKAKGLSQDQLSKKANIPYTTLTKIETGVIKNPSVFAIAKITSALGITIDDLMK